MPPRCATLIAVAGDVAALGVEHFDAADEEAGRRERALAALSLGDLGQGHWLSLLDFVEAGKTSFHDLAQFHLSGWDGSGNGGQDSSDSEELHVENW
jgi:hypothetical protein